MKRFRLIILIVLLLGVAALGAGCAPASFDIDYQVEETVYRPGDQISIELKVINKGSRFKEHIAHSFWTALITGTEGEEHYLFPRNKPFPENVGDRVYKKGEVVCVWSEIFDVSEDAPVGDYHLKVYVFGSEFVIPNIIEIRD